MIAARLLRDAGEHANAAYVDGLLASQLDRLGNPERAWLMWRKSLEETNRDGVLLNASISATRFGWHRTALDLQIAATDAARRAGRITTVADGLRWQAITNARLGRFEDSQQRIAEARAIAADRTGAAWDRLRAEIDVAAAEGGRSPAARISSASRALAYFEASKSAVRLPEILLVRARARLSAGDADGAHADASHGVRAVIDLRQQVGPGIDQLRFADVVRRLVGTLVELEDRRGRLRDAFETVDEARARDVPDAGAPVSIHTLERRVPTNAALLAFVVGDEHSYIWTVRSGTSTASRIAAGRTAVARLVDAAGPPRFESRAARELRRLFFEPALRSLGTGALLIVVPDGPLHTLPIATLPGTRSAYLIEEHPILLTPSARTWLHASSRLPSQATPPSRVFVAGNPRIDADRYGHLPDLPSAAAEARAVAALYGTTPLTGDAVTRAAVFAGLDADVVHFAGHALVNDVNPAESELVVWDPQGPGVSAGQITAGMCHRTRLVVLGACRSSSGPLTRTEGPISLARAFLAAGAPTVVATHWVVDDEATKALLIRFHEAYRATGDAAGSLREAQLQLIRSPDGTLRQPTNWAGFVAFGGTPLRQQ